VSEVTVVVLSILALGLMIFGIGAIAGWTWAVKSLRVPPPRWIPGVMLVAGMLFVAANVLQDQWLTAASWALFFVLLIGGMLRIGPFRQPPGA
jgi:hypothetical protein